MTENVGKGIRTSNNFFTSDFYKFGETGFPILSKYIFLIQSCFPFATSTWKSFLDFFIKLFTFSNIFISRIKSINIKSFSKFVCKIFIGIFVLASMIVNINKYYKLTSNLLQKTQQNQNLTTSGMSLKMLLSHKYFIKSWWQCATAICK